MIFAPVKVPWDPMFLLPIGLVPMEGRWRKDALHETIL
jgi:hypothetical protein